MRPARFLAPMVPLAVTLAVGCGSSASDSDSGPETTKAPAGASAQVCPIDVGAIEELRVTAVSCGTAQKVATDWNRTTGCSLPVGASRGGCTVRGFRCLGTESERGIAVSCARPQHSVAFIVKRG